MFKRGRAPAGELQAGGHGLSSARERSVRRVSRIPILGAAAVLAVLSLAASAAAESFTPGLPSSSNLVTKNAPLPPSGDPLLPFVSDSGLISLSVDAIGTNNAEGAPLKVHKNAAGATVRKAFLFAASTGETEYTPVNGDVTLDGTPIEWNAAHTISNDIKSVNVEADVTSIVKKKIDEAPAGDVSFTAAEPKNTELMDGEILAVTLSDPTVKEARSITILYGAQKTSGDTFHVALAEPVNKKKPGFGLDLSLGISYSYDTGSEQYSTVEVNKKLMTSSAGGQDDCVQKYEAIPSYAECHNGTLITAGGIGDTNENPPEPLATPSTCKNAGGEPAPRCDDELYSLVPFVSEGEKELEFTTANPSNNDNIFFAALSGAAAVVGEGITLKPTEATNKVRQPHTLTATVQDEKGKRIEGRKVTFKVESGPNAGTKGEAPTDVNGEAKFTYTSTKEGTDHIVASFTNAKAETQTSNEVTKTWEKEEVTKHGTCGNTNVGKISDKLSANVKRVNACVLPVNATATEVSVYLTPTSTSGQQLIEGIVYADSKGKPAGLLGTTTQLTFLSTSPAGWYHLTFPSPVKLAAGKYWIGIISGVSKRVAAERYEPLKNAEDYNTNTYTSGPSNPFGSFKTTNELMSLYLTYTPS